MKAHVANRANAEHAEQQTLGNKEKGVKKRDFVAEDTREGLTKDKTRG